MKVNVLGYGVVNFPDSMEESEVRAVLKQFEKPKDDTLERLVQSLIALVEKQKPQIVKDTVPVEIEKQVIVEKPVIQTVEIPGKAERTAWDFTIERKGDQVTKIKARPV